MVENRPILCAEYHLPLWPKLTHPAVQSLCDSWAACFFHISNLLVTNLKSDLKSLIFVLNLTGRELVNTGGSVHVKCRPWTNSLKAVGRWVTWLGDNVFAACCWPCTCWFESDRLCSLRHHGSPVTVAPPLWRPRLPRSDTEFYSVLRCVMVVVSDYSCDVPRFNFWDGIAKFSNQIANWITLFQIKSLHLKSNRQNGSDRDLNPNRNLGSVDSGGLRSMVIDLTDFVNSSYPYPYKSCYMGGRCKTTNIMIPLFIHWPKCT